MSEEFLNAETVLKLASSGDCSDLSAEQSLAYYKARCDAAGLDYRAQPFQFISLQGKKVLYALKGATDQLAAKHGIVCEIKEQKTEGGIRVVTVHAHTKDGRETDEIGAVPVEGLKGDQLANAMMKAVTKAKRRAVLSLCGLGMMDETELETIPELKALPDTPKPNGAAEQPATPQPSPPPATAAPSGDMTHDREITFGKDRGTWLSEMPMDKLQWYTGIFRDGMDDPKKAKFREKNRDMHECCMKELERRAAGDVDPFPEDMPI